MEHSKACFWQLVALAMLLTIVSQAIHEAGHWAVYKTAGLGPAWGFTGLVQLWGEMPVHSEEWVETSSPDGERGWLRLTAAPSKTEDIIGLAAGPLASLVAVVFGLIMGRLSRNQFTRRVGLVLALLGSLLMSQYYLRGFSRHGGDEYFLAGHLNVPKYIIDIPFGMAFLVCLLVGLNQLGNWRTRIKWMSAILLGSVPAGAALVGAHDLVTSRINQGDPLFQPVLGVSLPVLVVNVVAVLSLWIWWKEAKDRDSATRRGKWD